jgi:archaeosine-15-forming tRNA-guanine transglycosylase
LKIIFYANHNRYNIAANVLQYPDGIQLQSANKKFLNLMSSAVIPQRHAVTVRCDHHCGIRDQTEPFVHGGKEVFAQYLLKKTKKILN